MFSICVHVCLCVFTGLSALIIFIVFNELLNAYLSYRQTHYSLLSFFMKYIYPLFSQLHIGAYNFYVRHILFVLDTLNEDHTLHMKAKARARKCQ